MTSTVPPVSRSVVFSRGAAYINVSILISIVVICFYATTYLNQIEHSLADVGKTLKEVKAQLAKQDGATHDHSRRLLRLEDRSGALKEELNRLRDRVKDLEKGK